jgi:succinate dehydrogenase / fumarate reductase, cytochrome b subunit
MRQRPLSPHLSIYRFRYTLTSSIANRMTGVALSAGLPLLVIWLMAVASGGEAYERTRQLFGHVGGRVLLALAIVAFVYHTLAGVRHLIWDTGRALEREQARRSAWLLAVATLVLSAALIYIAFGDTGGSK